MKKRSIILTLLFSIISACYGQCDFVDSLNHLLNKFSSSYVKEDIFTITNSQFYEPGQNIEFKSIIRNWHGNVNIKSNYLDIYLTNDHGKKITESKFLIEDDYVSNIINIPLNINSGIYYLYASTNKNNLPNNYFKPILISKDKFQEVNTIIRYNKDYFFPNDTIQIKLKLFNVFGKNLRNKKIKYSIISQIEKLEKGHVITNIKGEADIQYIVPEYLKDSILKFEFNYKYASNNQSFISYCKIANNQLKINFYPEGGTLINNNISKLAFKILDYNGFPIKAVGFLKSNSKSYTFNTNADGIGLVEFRPDINSTYNIELIYPKNCTLDYKFPNINTKGTSVKVENINEENLTVILRSSVITDTLNTFLILDQNGEIKWDTTINLSEHKTYEIPCASLSHGLARITIFDINQNILNERIVFIPKYHNITKTSSDINYNKDSVNIKLNIKTQHKNFEYNLLTSIVNRAYFDNSIIDEYIQYYSIDPQCFDKEFSPFLYYNNGEVNYIEIDKIALTLSNKYIKWDTIINQRKEYISKSLKKINNTKDLYNDRVMEFHNFKNYNLLLTKRELFFNNIYTNENLYIKRIKEIKKSYNKSDSYKILIIEQLQNSNLSLEQAIKKIKHFDTDIYGHIIFRGHNSMLYEKGALIIVDGVKLGNTVSHLKYITSSSVEDIQILTSPYETNNYFTTYSSIIDIKTNVGKKIYDVDFKTNKKQIDIFQQNFLWSPNNKFYTSDQVNFKLKKMNNATLIMLGYNKNNSPFYYTVEIK